MPTRFLAREDGMGEYFSRFGGLWIDKTDQELVAKQIAAIDDKRLRSEVEDFNRDGFVIMRGAIDHAVIDTYLREYEIAASTRGILLISTPGHSRPVEPFDLELTRRPGT